MQTKYHIVIKNDAITENLRRLSNHIFKILPLKEEKGNWKEALTKVIIEITSINDIIEDQIEFFYLLTELNSLFYLIEDDDFPLFRKTIFKSLSIMKEIIKKCDSIDTQF